MNRRTMAVASITVALALAVAVPAGIAAKGRPGSEAANNLSVPTILVGGGAFTGVACGAGVPSPLIDPSGTPRTGYEVDPSAFYYVQGEHRWQAQCVSETAASAGAEWGDNLNGDAKLRIGKPIRVELGLTTAANPDGLLGFTVIKLEPSKLDRDSAYGTLAETVDGAWVATPDAFDTLRVYDGRATFSIQNVTTGNFVVPPGTVAKGEINATGRVVYGYQLKVMSRGQYAITYDLPNVTLDGTDAGTFGDHWVTLVITVI